MQAAGMSVRSIASSQPILPSWTQTSNLTRAGHSNNYQCPGGRLQRSVKYQRCVITVYIEHYCDGNKCN